jgi:CBS domain containing-hemolysin-like protein
LADQLSILPWLTYIAFLPVTRLLEHLLSAAEQEAWRAPDPEDAAVLNAVEEGTREGTIDAYDSEMIANVIRLGDRVARQVMTPRPDIVALAQTERVRSALAIAQEHGLSRLPVYKGDLDSIVGILHVREGSAALLDGHPPPDLTSLIRPALFVPEVQRVDLLLRELRARNTHMAIVVNEHGETAGLVTIEDLLEEIVGEIEDEFDMPEVHILPAGAGAVDADAAVLIAEVNEALDLALADDEVDTIGGLVYNTMGRVPNPGDSVTVDGAELEVLQTDANRIMRVRVRKIAPEADDGG